MRAVAVLLCVLPSACTTGTQPRGASRQPPPLAQNVAAPDKTDPPSRRCPDGARERTGKRSEDVLERYPDSVVWATWCEKADGTLHGPATGSDEMLSDGPKVVGTYLDGRRHGPWKFTDKDGTTKSGDYVDDRRAGTWTEWNASGDRISKDEYKAGVKHGVSITWNAAGNKAYESTFRGGREHGVETLWHENGQRASQGEFVRGKQEGVWHRWSRGGDVLSEGTYLRGVRHGRWSWFWSSRKRMRRDGHYRCGVATGRWTRFHFSGTRAEVGEFVRHRHEGTWTAWHRNGQKKWQCEFKAGEPSDVSTWHQSGRIAVRGRYTNGADMPDVFRCEDSSGLTVWKKGSKRPLPEFCREAADVACNVLTPRGNRMRPSRDCEAVASSPSGRFTPAPRPGDIGDVAALRAAFSRTGAADLAISRTYAESLQQASLDRLTERTAMFIRMKSREVTVHGVSRNSLFAAMGLADRDTLVRVAGTILTLSAASEEELERSIGRAFFDDLRSNGKTTVEVRRGGRQLVLRYSLVP